jgi:plastocyanin
MSGRMGTPRGSGRRGRLVLALLLAGGAALHLVSASSAEGPTIEAGEAGGGYVWRPSTATVGLGGSVAFKSTSVSIPHSVSWTGGPEKPSCSGVPIDSEKTNWSGTCTFAQPGTYAFVCYVHPTEMKGTITVSASAVPPGPPPPVGGSSESPLQGAASKAVRIGKSQRGASVRGSVDLSPVSAGGRLEVLLLAKRAALSGAGAKGAARVGRLVLTSLHAGRRSFAVPLKGAGRRALSRLEKLSLSVKLVLAPPAGAALTLKRGVVLHD